MSRGPIPDDFEYPMPKKSEVLWTLPDKKRTIRASQSPPRNPVDISDIDGAHSSTTEKYRIMQKFTHKPDLMATASIEGATCKRLVPVEPLHNNPLQDKSLKTDDLPHAKPEMQKFRTERVVNPLEPQYRTSSQPPGLYTKRADRAPSPPRHSTVREVLKIDDIPGTKAADNKSNNIIHTERPPRDIIDYSDVPLSTACSKLDTKKRTSPSMALTTSDICLNTPQGIQSTRHTSPLDPRYTIRGPKDTIVEIGDVEGSHPRKAPRGRIDRPSMILRCDDIEGAQPLKRFS